MGTSSKGKGYFALFLTSTLWGTTWIVSKIGIRDIPALQMSSLRQFIAGGCFVLFFMLYKKLEWPSRKQWQWLLMMAVLMFVIANGLSTLSLKYISAGLGALIGALYPLSVVLIQRFIFKAEKISIITLVGCFLGIAGIGIVFYENAFHHSGNNFIMGVVLSLIAMLAWSFGTVFIARNKMQMNPYYATGWQMLISSAILMVVSYFVSPLIPLKEITFKAWASILYLVFFGSIVTFVAFIYSMKHLKPAIASLYAYINPLIALAAAAVILHEKLNMNIIWGALVTLAGVFLVNYSLKNKRKAIVENEM